MATWHCIFLQFGKKAMSHSPWLVDFVVELVDSVFDSPMWKWRFLFLGKIVLRKFQLHRYILLDTEIIVSNPFNHTRQKCLGDKWLGLLGQYVIVYARRNSLRLFLVENSVFSPAMIKKTIRAHLCWTVFCLPIKLKCHSSIAVLYPIFGHPLIESISALGCHTCHCCVTAKIHLKPLVKVIS